MGFQLEEILKGLNLYPKKIRVFCFDLSRAETDSFFALQGLGDLEVIFKKRMVLQPTYINNNKL
jgi:hypothetical protein